MVVFSEIVNMHFTSSSHSQQKQILITCYLNWSNALSAGCTLGCIYSTTNSITWNQLFHGSLSAAAKHTVTTLHSVCPQSWIGLSSVLRPHQHSIHRVWEKTAPLNKML